MNHKKRTGKLGRNENKSVKQGGKEKMMVRTLTLIMVAIIYLAAGQPVHLLSTIQLFICRE